MYLAILAPLLLPLALAAPSPQDPNTITLDPNNPDCHAPKSGTGFYCSYVSQVCLLHGQKLCVPPSHRNTNCATHIARLHSLWRLLGRKLGRFLHC
ncbi:hypothetical protein EJ03DRAFT_329580 [Teratosphaeria nubilosa]|uniref:Uncharacterized protein n=1 Tax=Teratosphaeria nubilosa TaxID=161662 RepID=A0A6G1L2V9_9PEZI|nr:hypothetical protein EJ03DRAFT_329580 [Teratosphaeria nubilosa]